MEVTTLKVVVLVSLGLLKLLCGLLPILLTKLLNKSRAKCNHRLIGVVLCIGGGVLLATVNVHMIPEVRESLQKASSFMGEELSEYPVAELLICLGFLLIFLIEAVVHKFFSHGGGHAHDHGLGCPHPSLTKPGLRSRQAQELVRNYVQAKTDSRLGGVHNGAFEGHSCSGSPTLETSRNSSENSTASTMKQPRLTSSYKTVSEDDQKMNTIAWLHPSDANNVLKTAPPKPQKEHKIMAKLKNIIMVLALGFHGVFEGMAIGLQEDEGGVLKLFMAVAIHAVAIMFCCGMDMVATNTKKMQILLYVSVLSAVSPVGVAVGILVTNQQADTAGHHAFVVGVLQGLAGGTLLYVTFFEVLDRQRLKKYGMTGLMGVVAIVIGFSMMAALEAVGGHSHGGGSHQGHLGHSGHAPHESNEGHLDHSGHDHDTAHLYPAQVKNSTIDRIMDHYDHPSDNKHDHDGHDSHEDHDHDNQKGHKSNEDDDKHDDHDIHEDHTDHEHNNHEDQDSHDDHTDHDHNNHKDNESHDDHKDHDHGSHDELQHRDKDEDHDNHGHDIHEAHTDQDHANHKDRVSHEDHTNHDHANLKDHDKHEDHTDHDHHVHEDHEKHEDHDKHTDQTDHDLDKHEDHESHEDNERHEDHTDHDHDKHEDHESHEDNERHEDHKDHGSHEDHDSHDDHEKPEDHFNQDHDTNEDHTNQGSHEDHEHNDNHDHDSNNTNEDHTDNSHNNHDTHEDHTDHDHNKNHTDHEDHDE